MIIFDAYSYLFNLQDIYVECGSGLQFPTEGIRRYTTSTPHGPGSTSTSLGEGLGLFYW